MIVRERPLLCVVDQEGGQSFRLSGVLFSFPTVCYCEVMLTLSIYIYYIQYIYMIYNIYIVIAYMILYILYNR